MNTTSIHVPCDVFSVQVQLGYDSKLSEIEQIVLRAVHHYPELRGLDELSTALNLGRPLTLDIAFDLMRRRYALVDFATGSMRPTPEISKRIQDGTLADLPGAEIIDDRKLVMLDLLSGHTLPLTGRDRLVRSRFAVPVETGTVDLATVSQSELLSAINRTLDAEYGDLLKTKAGDGEKARGRRLRAHSAHLGPQDRRPVVGRRWLEMRVALAIDPVTDRLRVRIDDDVLPPARREIAEARLQQLAADRPNDEFVQTLRAQAHQGSLQSYTFDDYLNRMGRLLDGAEKAVPGTRRKRHRDLAFAAQRAHELLQADRDLETHVHPVHGRAAIVQQVREVIASARRQVVLASPYVDDDFFAYHQAIDAAVANGVQVVVLWGRRHTDRLPDRARTALYQFNRQHRAHRVVWSERPSRINTSLAIADDRLAVVASGSIFYGRGRGRLVGATLGAARDDAACRPIETMLLLMRRSFPDAVLSESIATRHDDLRAPVSAGRLSATESTARTGPPGVPDTPSEQDDDAGGGQMRAWASAWRGVVDNLRTARQGRGLPEVRVITEDEHRHLMWSALLGTDERVVVGSRFARATVVNPRFEEVARRRLVAGAALTVLVKRPEEPRDPATVVLNSLAAMPSARYAEHPDRAVDGGVLITDRSVVVTGFELLVEGDRRTRREWLTVGVQIRSRRLADAFATLVAGSRTEAETSEAPQVAEPSDNRAAIVTHRLLLGGIDLADPAALARALDEAVDPWAVVAQMRDLSVNREVLRRVTLATLAAAGTFDTPDAQQALRWLVRDLWCQRQFMEATLIREVIADVGWSPRPPLAAAAAARGDLWFVSALSDAVLDNPTPAEAVALALNGVAALLTGVTATATDQTAALMEVDQAVDCLTDLPGPVAALVDAAREHFDQTQRPLPLAAIQRAVTRAVSEQRVAQTWAALDDALDKAHQYSFDFDRGVKTHEYLFHPNGSFGSLLAIVPGRKPESLREWLAEHDVRNIGRFLDKATSAATGGRVRIEARRRARYLERLGAVTKLVIRLAALDSDGATEVNVAQSIAARMAASVLADRWTGLTEVVAGLDEAERALSAAALSDLEDIRRWSTE